MNHRQRSAVGAVAAIGATTVAAGSAQAADFTVANLTNSGTGSLRAAINAANMNPDSDRILFQSGLTGNIALTAQLPEITAPVEIDGPGASTLSVAGPSIGGLRTAADTTISGLALNAGVRAQGGAIEALGNHHLTLSGDSFTGNSSTSDKGGAIYIQDGSLTVSNSTFTGNVAKTSGGAISGKDSDIAISGSTFTGNVSSLFGDGGAIYNDGTGTTSVSGTTFTQNVSVNGGAAISSDSTGLTTIDSSTFDRNQGGPYGSALALYHSASALISNSTFTGNTFDHGGASIVSDKGAIIVDSSTIVGNTMANPPSDPNYQGAGIQAGRGLITLRNSIVAGNVPADLGSRPAGTPPNPPPAGSFNSAFDLIGNKGVAPVTDAVPGSDLTAADPQLGPLADNGGPTRTMLPADTSPVINKGSSALTTDQRGLTRPVDFRLIPFSTAAGSNGADLGAVELQFTPPSNSFSFGKVKLNKKKGIATLQVKVPGAGKLVLAGSKSLKGLKKTVKGKATVGLTLKARDNAAKKLKTKGKFKVKAKVTFTPTYGSAKAKSRSVTLVRKKKKKH